MITTSLPALARAAESEQVGNTTLNIAIFAAFVVLTLVFVIRASRTNKSTSQMYTAGASFTGRQNGFAISGDYLSAASFLGIAGAIALTGYDGFLYSIGFLVAWVIALLLVAELLRNTGRFTMADVLSFRMQERPVRTAAAVSTLVVSFFYLLAQMAGAGGLVALLLNINDSFGQALVIAGVGALMIVYVLVGGMKGTTYVQIIKAILLIGAALLMTVWVLAQYGFNFSDLLGDGAAAGAALEPGKKYGLDGVTKIDFISLSVALVLGTAGLPHILMRFYTVPTAKEARKSVVWAIWLIGLFYLFTLTLGYGAAALVGPERIAAAPGAANSAAPLLAYELGGTLLLGIVSAVAFATILAVVAGLTITASASFAHDIYTNVIHRGKAPDGQEVKVARIAAIVIGIVAILGGIAANGQNIAFLVALAFAVAASANLPTILYSLFWKRFNTRGCLWSIYGGLIITVGLIVFSPAVSGSETAMFPDQDWSWFPLANPGLVSIPASFLLGIIGTLTSKEHLEIKAAEMEVRALTGAGAEGKALDH
ncbi:cation acetate symporter [Aeromicrobium tamlense]|uniref:Cation acetate symporter n=1 Tax=Aeromicrobium tamlense TaxID=375541 RepID=A0A8I0FWB7_9ACTN|nr:cation acetate symporter [Aeromicrobium tamlense]MBD1270296.1 cation acetate symporter [Aeromicrobium tamlense]MBD1271572.1 cation acetate symporter [Aeromicrobium tamlense]NYI37682.1 cation/acetate symporter [Aeromicrobium tamlense]